MGDFSFDGLFLIVWCSFFKLPVWGFSLSEHSQRIQGIVPGNRVAGERRPGGLEIQNRNTDTRSSATPIKQKGWTGPIME